MASKVTSRMASWMALLLTGLLAAPAGARAEALPSVVPLLSMTAGTRAMTAGTKAMKDGSFCAYNLKRQPVAPFCPGNKYNCVVQYLPNLEVQIYGGYCNSRHTRGSYCKFNRIPYAPGTQRITENPLCHTCDCQRDPSIPGTNKAACMCAKLPPCYVDYGGKPVGRFRCPNKQDLCVVTRPGGGGKDKRGLPVDMGQCVFAGIGSLCATGGPTWGPKFYASGVIGVPKASNRCISCTCSRTGRLTKCKRITGCKHP